MKTLLEQLKEAYKTGKSEFDSLRRESNSSLKQDSQEMIEEFKKVFDKGSEKARQKASKAQNKYQDILNQYKEDKSKNETCSQDCCDDQDCKCENCEEEQNTNFESFINSLFEDLFNQKENFEKQAQLLQLVAELSVVQEEIIELFEARELSIDVSKDALFITSLVRVNLLKFINDEDDEDTKDDIITLIHELVQLESKVDLNRFSDFVYGLILTFDEE